MSTEISLFNIRDKLRFLIASNQNFKLQLSGYVIAKAVSTNTMLEIIKITDSGMIIQAPDGSKKEVSNLDMKTIPASELTLLMQTDVEDAIAAITVATDPISSATDPRLNYTTVFEAGKENEGWYFTRDKSSHEPMIIVFIDGAAGVWHDGGEDHYIGQVQGFIQNNNAEIAGPIIWPEDS